MSTTPTAEQPLVTTAVKKFYTPKGAENLANYKETIKMMVAIMGAPKSGKTTSALTFPNVVAAEIDPSGLAGHVGKDIIRLPFNSTDWVKKNTGQPNLRDGFKMWLTGTDEKGIGPGVAEAAKLDPEQTLVLDSWTTLQDAFDVQTRLEPILNKQGDEDTRAFWGRKQEYALAIIKGLSALRCHVVVIFHETVKRDEDGEITSKMLPLMQGGFVDKLPIYFSDWFRQHARDIKTKTPEGKTIVTGQEYLWQFKPDSLANCSSRMREVPHAIDKIYIPAHYSSLRY